MRTKLAALLLVVASGCATVKEPVIAPDWTEADASKPLTHADCVRLATRSAPTAAAWRARLLSAQAAFRQAGKLPNPGLSLSWEDIGAGGTPDADVAATAADVLDNERAAECFLQARRDQPRGDIGRATRRIGHDHLDRLVGRPRGVSGGRAQQCGARDTAGNRESRTANHATSARMIALWSRHRSLP